jgi:hypothetical protein
MIGSGGLGFVLPRRRFDTDVGPIGLEIEKKEGPGFVARGGPERSVRLRKLFAC